MIEGNNIRKTFRLVGKGNYDNVSISMYPIHVMYEALEGRQGG